MLATAFPLALSVAAWCFCIACLLPAVWRLLRRRGRYLDPVWALTYAPGNVTGQLAMLLPYIAAA